MHSSIFLPKKFLLIMGLLTGRTALVTGATRGIGRAVALKLASEGADIAFTYRSQHEAAESLVAELEALGVRAKAYASDAASFEDAHKVADDVKETFGRIDILVNNAGVTKDGLMMRMDEAQWDMVLDNNLKSAFNYIHACTPIMARQRCGSIINMSSVVGVAGNAGQCNYAASKAGIIGLSKSIAKEMGVRGIRSNCIAPGFIATDMTDGAEGTTGLVIRDRLKEYYGIEVLSLPEELRKEWEKQIPLRRGGTPEDVANVALFLASDLSSYVTGQVINCCGGMNC